MILFAKRNGLAYRGHVLIWASPDDNGHKIPKFILKENDKGMLEKKMQEYINTAVKGLYPENVKYWDVVNEAISDEKLLYYKKSHWSKIDNFVCKAFKFARAANPHATLTYNDYNAEGMSRTWGQKTKSDKVFKLIKDNKDCGIDAVGF